MTTDITPLSDFSFIPAWEEALEELDNEEGAEALPFEDCERIVLTKLKATLKAFKEDIKEQTNKYGWIGVDLTNTLNKHFGALANSDDKTNEVKEE